MHYPRYCSSNLRLDKTSQNYIKLHFPETGIRIGPKAPQTLGYHCVSGLQNSECLLINYNTSWKSWKLLVMPSYGLIFNQQTSKFHPSKIKIQSQNSSHAKPALLPTLFQELLVENEPKPHGIHTGGKVYVQEEWMHHSSVQTGRQPLTYLTGA